MYFEYEDEGQCINCGKPTVDKNPYCEDCEMEEMAFLQSIGIIR